jgi:hypothetical protein
MDGHGGIRKIGSHASIAEMDDFDLTRLLDKPRLNIERQRSFDERSLSELSVGFARAGLDNYDNYSPGGRSGFNTPASSARNSFEPHPMVADAWESLRKSLVHFRGQPVGTIAAVDHQSEEVLNYDQVNFFSVLFWAVLCTLIFKHVIHGYNRVIKLQSIKLS